ncbi:hypothetical protein ESCO_001723 [Escovopsis weberi]|uniref:Pentatricopeptide repeat-containing protein n=1 Tax=Escovopsis weberi TaxID=150374 RepID=A0A0M9VWW7_ESCWE|nr:hypothetical protein ESCO_001723 [Escovopsis weberi]
MPGSVFATAALVDAIRKDDRRQSLDRRIEEARRDLADLQERRPAEAPDFVDQNMDSHFLNIYQMDALWNNLKGILIHRPYMKEIHKPATISASALVESLKRDYYGCPSDADLGGPARRRIDYEQLERAITAEELDKRMLYRQSQKPAHLQMESNSTEDLVLRFLDRAKFLPESDLPSPSFDEACRLMRKGYPRFTFRAIDPEGSKNDTTKLNRRLRALVATSDMSMRERIGRVCYNLLISAYPPDMHTYNTLIAAFNRSGHHTFAEALVSSFFHSRLLQPTPSTYVAILNHYKCTNNHGKFLRALACLTGTEPTLGGKIRRRHVKDIELSPLLQQWAADMRRRTQTGDWVWEHIPMTQPLVEEIICGLLHFKLFEQAVSLFLTSINYGLRLSMHTARLVLDGCVDALDWRAAVRMIRSITNSQGKWRRFLSTADPESKQLIAARMRALIDICGLHSASQPARRTTLTQLRIYNSKYAKFLEMMEQEAPLRPDSLALHDRFDGAKSRLLRLESLGKELDFVCKTTMSIESKLLYPHFSDAFRASMALHIGAAAIKRSAQLSEEIESLIAGLDIAGEEPSASTDRGRAEHVETREGEAR